MQHVPLDKPRSDLPICPICKVPAELEQKFCWIISASVLSYCLGAWECFYAELNCCGACYPKIHHRRLLQITLLVFLPIAVVLSFLLKYFVFKDLLTNMSDVRMFLANVAIAWVIWFALFKATGLDRVRVSEHELIEKGKQLSRQRLRNSTPWFSLAYSPRGAERIEFDEDISNAEEK